MLIDPAIRDWVMIPLLLLVIISVYLRIFASRLLTEAKPMDAGEMAQRNTVARSQRLRASAGYISYAGFMMRKEWLGEEGTGKLQGDVVNKSAMGPMAQIDMFKQQVRCGGGGGGGGKR